WYVQGKLPQREGEVAIAGLQAPVSVRYDARGVPHLQAQSEPDLYRAL
ncbi:penicillin acylase family protein, partial [Pseudomonas putida]